MFCKHHSLPPPLGLKLSKDGNRVNTTTFGYLFQLFVWGRNKIAQNQNVAHFQNK